MDIHGFSGPFRFLSNFYPCSVTLDGLTFPSVEHAYQAAKTTDPSIRRFFAQAGLPAGQIKRLSREIGLRADWLEVRERVMLELLRQKFQHEPLRGWLLDTTGHLEETNNWGDTFWGVCDGVGSNVLGELLMHVRAEMPR